MTTAVADTGRGNPPSLIALRDGRLALTYGYRAAPFGIRAAPQPRRGPHAGSPSVCCARMRATGTSAIRGACSARTAGSSPSTTTTTPAQPERYIAATIWAPGRMRTRWLARSDPDCRGRRLWRRGRLRAGRRERRSICDRRRLPSRRARRRASGSPPTFCARKSPSAPGSPGTCRRPGRRRARSIALALGSTRPWAPATGASPPRRTRPRRAPKAIASSPARGRARHRLDRRRRSARRCSMASAALLRALDWVARSAALPRALDVATRAALSASRPSARLPASLEHLRRLDAGAVRSLHPRAGAPRRQRHREHPVPGQSPGPAHAGLARGDGAPHQRDLREVRPAVLAVDARRFRSRRHGEARRRRWRRSTRSLPTCRASTASSSPAAILVTTTRRWSCPGSADLATRLRVRHPQAKVWLSLQHFDAKEVDFLFAWIDREHPRLAGRAHRRSGQRAAGGDAGAARSRATRCATIPTSRTPSAASTRYRRGTRRSTSRSAASRSTRARRSTRGTHDRLAPDTDGFITYSDGVNDDVNKIVWTRKAWDPDARRADDPRRVRARLLQPGGRRARRRRPARARAQLGRSARRERRRRRDARALAADRARRAGARRRVALADGAVTRLLRRLHARPAAARDLARSLGQRWRWPRRRASAPPRPWTAPRPSSPVRPAAAVPMARAASRSCARRCSSASACRPACRQHQASGYERGAILDFVDHPLNNRWWLEDQFAAVRALA